MRNDLSVFSDSEFALIAREVKARTGYVLSRELGPSIEARLMALQRRENLMSVRDLITNARVNGNLWTTIADALVVQDTRFFRDRALFTALREEILPGLFPVDGRRLRIWSAGCSTGQEALSLALISEALRDDGLAGADIIATDCSERLLEKARSGLYTQFEVQRGLPIRTLIAHFEKAGDLWRASDRLRALIRYEQHNLLDPAEGLGSFDVIVCCNVLNTLDAEARAHALGQFAEALKPDGLLITGEAEAPGEAFEPATIGKGVFRRNAAWRKAA